MEHPVPVSQRSTRYFKESLRERNDEILERIDRDRRFTCNFPEGDTERLENLFELYTKMTTKQVTPKKTAKRKPKGTR